MPNSKTTVTACGIVLLAMVSFSGSESFANTEPCDIRTMLGESSDVETAMGVVNQGGMLYAADYSNGLVILDMSDPANPIESASYETPGPARGVAVDGDRAFIADTDTLRAFDISDPTEPIYLGSIPTHFSKRVTVRNGIAYIADSGGGLHIVDVSDPKGMTEVSRLETPGYAVDIQLVGNLAYIANAYDGFSIIDITDPSAPILLSTTYIGHYISGIAVDGAIAYVVGSGVGGFWVYDTQTPQSPKSLSVLSLPSNTPDAIALYESYACIVDNTRGFQVINIANPQVPVLVDSNWVNGSYRHLVVQDQVAYIAANSSGVQLFDLSSCPPCPADLNDDDQTDFIDISAFLDAYTAGNFIADLNNDGQTDFIDISAFLSSYAAGCP